MFKSGRKKDRQCSEEIVRSNLGLLPSSLQCGIDNLPPYLVHNLLAVMTPLRKEDLFRFLLIIR